MVLSVVCVLIHLLIFLGATKRGISIEGWEAADPMYAIRPGSTVSSLA